MTNREEALTDLIDYARVLLDTSDPAETLRVTGVLHGYVADIERAAVEQARFNGDSWEDIGSWLGMSRQAAWERFREQD